MKKELRDHQKITYTIIHLLMVYTLANVMSSVLVIDLNIVGKFFVTILIGLLVQLFVLIPTALLPILGVLVGALLLYTFYDQEAIIRVLLWIQQFYQNISNHFARTEEIFVQNTTALWMIFTILLSLYTIIILFKTKRVYLLLPVYLLFFVYYWYIYIDVSYSMMAWFLILYIILLGCDGYVNALRVWVKERANYSIEVYPHWFKTAISYGLIIIIIAAILPKGGAVIDWYWLESKIQKRFPTLIDLRDDVVYSRAYSQAEPFNFTLTGFQPNISELGGPVQLSDRLVMKVKAPYPLYLRGNVKNRYNHNQWEKGSTKEETYDTSTAISIKANFGSRVIVEITHENLATSTVFSPYQPVRINNSGLKKMRVDENYQVTFLGYKYKGEKYEVRAHIPSRFVNFDKEEVLTGYSEYLQLPTELSDSVYKLGESITKGAISPYEKAILIRNYLRENYKYSLEPTSTPDGKDFVEYFLFEEKEGYCTYFATAMAILLRTQGIPSRYVEGYMLPSEEKDGTYEVTQRNAHAWVEAYMGNGSWITFEATPAFALATFQDIDIPNEGLEDSPETSVDDMERQSLDGREDIRDNPLEIDIDTPIVSNRLSEIWDKLSKALWMILIIFILSFVPMRVIYTHGRIKKYHKDLRKIRGSNTVLYLYQNISQLLDQLGYGILQGETAYEYAHRVNNKIYNYEHDFRKLTDLYVKAKYSQIEMSEEDKELIFDFFQFIERKVRYRKGSFKYVYKKYILGRLYHCYKVSDDTITYL
ncbi:transglutaminase TgpA family protein [Alkaliphilus serpentinus]|uniref:Transglutaminase domain-containing protein n=1 Tax=Alkaliphilus serpentinus TaxID=1482731 RepID=A0A833HMM2_9FIRM|nr:transglutaminaseTgpA domain-containing protein [Alkaliphilus serpentinus]KAB3527695.1 transglutaminase domain-containing protein [Alkaliphilus serpentinus]